MPFFGAAVLLYFEASVAIIVAAVQEPFKDLALPIAYCIPSRGDNHAGIRLDAYHEVDFDFPVFGSFKAAMPFFVAPHGNSHIEPEGR